MKGLFARYCCSPEIATGTGKKNGRNGNGNNTESIVFFYPSEVYRPACLVSRNLPSFRKALPSHSLDTHNRVYTHSYIPSHARLWNPLLFIGYIDFGTLFLFYHLAIGVALDIFIARGGSPRKFPQNAAADRLSTRSLLLLHIL